MTTHRVFISTIVVKFAEILLPSRSRYNSFVLVIHNIYPVIFTVGGNVDPRWSSRYVSDRKPKSSSFMSRVSKIHILKFRIPPTQELAVLSIYDK